MQIAIIIVIICFLLSHIMSVKIYNKNEHFKTNKDLNSIPTNCDCFDSINHKDKLFTPVAVNIPIDNTVFNTGDNIKTDNSMNVTGKYCFPIEKYIYDGIWNSNKKNIDDIPDKQTINWNLPTNKQIENIYCSDKFLTLPEKHMEPGDIIYNNNMYDKLNPSRHQVCERLDRQCNINNLSSDVIKTTLSKYTINGL